MILIAGSTGTVGRNVAQKLHTRGKGVRALVRPGAAQEKRRPLEVAGIPLVLGDLKDPASLRAACQGVNPAVHDQVIELGGPDPVSFNAVVSLFERALGRSVERLFVPEAALEQQLATAADLLQKTLAALALGVAHGDAIDNSDALAKARIRLTPVSARNVERRTQNGLFFVLCSVFCVLCSVLHNS